MQRIPSLFIALTEKKGRGVFTAENIAAGDLIEIAPLIVFEKSESGFLDQTKLNQYYFLLGENDGIPAVALGYGSLYNHSETPNAEVSLHAESQEMIVRCVKAIEVGEEITINYLAKDQKKIKLWF